MIPNAINTETESTPILFFACRIMIGAEMSQDTMKAIQRGLLLSYLGRGSAIPEINIPDIAGLKGIKGMARIVTTSFPGKMK
jgi:hypothetical protein